MGPVCASTFDKIAPASQQEQIENLNFPTKGWFLDVIAHGQTPVVIIRIVVVGTL